MRDVAAGGIGVGVPGTIAMLAMAQQAHGKLAWEKLFAPAIRLAEQGYAVPSRLSEAVKKNPRFAAMPDLALHFFPHGKPVESGVILRNPDYADTLRAIAAKGPDAFYKGAFARSITDAVRNAPQNPAVMTEADLQSYKAVERQALCGTYRTYRV
jgi:gamma-glutamyltranspeptidase/glutathione hydrolase